MSALEDIAAEGRRQVEAEGWTAEHDDTHADGAMAKAATCYAHNAMSFQTMAAVSPAAYQSALPGLTGVWPWSLDWWKPKNPRRDLVRAGALSVAEAERLERAGHSRADQDEFTSKVVAEIERLDRAAAKPL